MIKRISSSSNSRLKTARKLTTRNGVLKEGLFLMEGPRFVADSISRKKPEYVFISEDSTDTSRTAAEKAASEGCEVLEISRALFSGISDTEHSQGIAAVFRLPPQDLSNLPSQGLLVLLDGVADPGNMGTIVRSAAAFQCGAVVAGRGSCCPFIPKATRASAGANILLPVFFDVTLADLMEELKASVRFLGADTEGTPAENLRRTGTPEALVIGSEAHGISSEVTALLDRMIAIPISKKVESLNAAVSASILIHSLSGKADAEDLQNR
ncbi:MAG: hypothetical protein GF388_07080 [Candidatus Aegiribacteria sp.]|nr:hypothetical protein [Candidatus Aegiribacteria sp.]MBD3294896.1 hypothetical protein [Candidatus Fermentibacteria bacterium]